MFLPLSGQPLRFPTQGHEFATRCAVTCRLAENEAAADPDVSIKLAFGVLAFEVSH